MSPDGSGSGEGPGTPALVRQRELTEDLARLAVGAARAAGESFDLVCYQARALLPYQQEDLEVRRPDGSTRYLRVPDATLPLLRELRRVMYRPGAGTWFTATVCVDGDLEMSARFDYDDEPAWERPVEPVWYVEDLREFPRDDDAIPPWLRRQLDAADGPS